MSKNNNQIVSFPSGTITTTANSLNFAPYANPVYFIANKNVGYSPPVGNIITGLSPNYSIKNFITSISSINNLGGVPLNLVNSDENDEWIDQIIQEYEKNHYIKES